MNVSPKVDFVEDNESDHMPPKIQGVRVIVDATKMNGILKKKFYFQFFFQTFSSKLLI